MKDVKQVNQELNTSRKDARKSTEIKNTVEAYRAGVVGAKSTEYRFAACGCCTGLGHYPKISDVENKSVWDQSQYSFLSESYDISGQHLRVHPALWNNGTNNALSGVFEVLPGLIYQVRGYDMANITFVKTNPKKDNTGHVLLYDISEDDRWMVMDTLMSTECTQEALELFDEYLKSKVSNYSLKGNIVGMIVSHSHVDHYGGMSTVKEWFISADAYQKDALNITDNAIAVPFILAPKGFFEHSVSENVYVGNAMGRRASYQYGSFIKPNYTEAKSVDDYLSGEISIGIGQGQSTGKISFEVPTMEIGENCTLTLDNIKVEFQLTPGTEAPAEMNNYFSDYKALWLAENCNGTLHNLYTLRGAQVRDGKAWAKYLVEAAVLYGDITDVIFQSHNWPHWGTSIKLSTGEETKDIDLKDFLLDTAAIYKYINDQTLLYMNMGYKMNEAADMLTLPRAMQKNWCLKPFYGTPKHNAKAVYQRYLGWYDANPLHLEELPPEQLAQEQLRYMMVGGSIEGILNLITKDIENGNFWTAAYMAHQIVLGSNNLTEVEQAKILCADALEQLGYQSESGTWRNAYLCAAYELRNPKARVSVSGSNMTENMTVEMLLDYISILFDGERAAQLNFEDTFIITDVDGVDKYYLIIVRNGCILYHELSKDSETVPKLDRSTLISMIAASQGLSNDRPKNSNLASLLDCMVNLNVDRYRFFDIINKHDTEVIIGSRTIELPDLCMSCFKELQGYVPDNDKKIELTPPQIEAWRHFQVVLGLRAQILMSNKFFSRSDSMSNGETEGFYLYELYFDLYSMQRYFNAPYLKNGFSFEGEKDKVEEFERLKKKIQLLESYLPDCYLGNQDTRVGMDDNDKAAWEYLSNDSSRDDITWFMQQLYVAHEQLAKTLNTMDRTLYLGYLASSESLRVYCTLPQDGEYIMKCDDTEITLGNQPYMEVEIENMSDAIVFKVCKKSDEQYCIDSLEFYKPEVVVRKAGSTVNLSLSTDDVFIDDAILNEDSRVSILIPYGCPDPNPSPRPKINKYNIEYTTQYVVRLEIADTEMSNPVEGVVTIEAPEGEEKISVKGWAECGYYTEYEYNCKDGSIKPKL